MTEQRAAPATTGKINVANVIAWIVMGICAAAAVWWFGFREPPVVSVLEAGDALGGVSVRGIVRPRLSEENLALRAAEYQGVALEYFEIEDDTGVLPIYLDPAVIPLPPEGARVQVTGSRIPGSGGDFTGTHPFLAGRVTRIE
jgi:hypothetical protein